MFFEVILEWRKVQASGNSLVWFGNFIAFSDCGTTALIGLLIGSSTGGQAQASLEDENRRAKEAWEEKMTKEREKDAAATLQFKKDTEILTDMKNIVKRMLEDHYSNGPIYRKYQTYQQYASYMNTSTPDVLQSLGQPITSTNSRYASTVLLTTPRRPFRSSIN